MVEIIVYSYEMAPNPQKLFHFLAYFNIPFKYFQVSSCMPRPELASVGIEYRRTPVMSIDSDVYVDTAIMIEKLADIAAHSSDTDVDVRNHVAFDALGQHLFKLATALLPTDNPILRDETFLADRRELLGIAKFDAAAMKAARPHVVSDMMSYVSLIERTYLSSDKESFLLGEGEKPTTADLYIYWAVNWGLRYHEGARPEISPTTNPRIFAWLERVGAFLQPRRRDERVEWATVKEILVRPPKHEYAKFVPHQEDNPLGLKVGQAVTVTPTDTGKSHPQHGTLISLNPRQVCLRNRAGIVMHFPRINYIVAAAK